jgi:quercetin dioxygenase-like cupin family protein
MRLALLALILCAAPAAAQRIVPVHEEPRHRLVHDGEGFRVLDVRVAPGDTSWFHTHDAPITYVSIVPSTMDSQPLDGAWSGNDADDPPPFAAGEVAWNLSYAETGPATHRIANVGHGAFHLVAVVNSGPGESGPLAATGSAAAVVEAENPWFRISRVTLAAGDVFAWADAGRSGVGVLITGDGARVREDDGGETTIEAPGSFFVRSPGTAHEIRAAGSAPVELVLIDLKKPSEPRPDD